MNDILSFEEWVRQGKPSSGGKRIGKDPYLECRSEEEVQAEIGQLKDYSVRAESFLQSVNELTAGKDYYMPSEELIATGKALANEAPTMLRMYNANSRFMQDADTAGEALASSIGMIGDIASALEQDREYFSQYKDEEDFKLQTNAEEQMRNYYKSYDIEKGAQEVAAIKNGMDASNLARTELVNMEKDLARDHNGEFDWEASAAKVEFSGLSAHQIRKLYEKHLMAYNEMDAGDYYDIYEKALKEHEDRVFKKKSYEYQDFLRVDGFQEKANAGRKKAKDKISGDFKDELYGYEEDIYFYLLNEKGEDEAKKYVEFLKPSLKERRGETIGREINDIDNHALRWIVANSYAGITNTIGAFRDIAEVFVNFDTPAVHEHANDYIRRNARNGFERVSLDISATTGAMVPAVAAGIATGGTAWGPIAVNIMQGLQASGAKEREMVAAGYTRREAQNAGLLVGIGEATIGSVLDTTFGATGIPGAIEKKIDNISSAYGKASAKFLSHVGGEIVEEEAMLFLEPYIQSLVTGEEYTVPEMEEILYTALITAVSTGVIDIVGGQTFSGSIDQTRKTRAVGQQLIGSDASSAVKALGLKSDNVGIQNLAKKINDAPTGRRQEIRTGSLYERLVAAENSKNAISDRADIRKRLQDKETLGDKSFDAETAGAIADAVVASRNGQELSADQRKVLKKYGNDSRVEKVVDSLWGAGEAKLGQKTPVADIYRTAVKTNKLKALGLSEEAAKKMASGDTEGALKSMALSTGRVSVKSVGTDGTVTINGKTTSVADAAFKSEFQRNAYSAVMGAKNMTPEAANLILGVRANMNGRDVEAALKVYQRGVAGEPMGDVTTTLSKAHMDAIYKAGMRVHNEGVYTAEQKVKNIYDRASKALEKSGEKVTGSLMADKGVDISKLTGTEKRVADLAAEIAPSLSVDIALYRDNDSQATGFYDYESDTIYLNVASKVDLTTREGKETAMAFTLGHELLHRARVGTPKGYDSFVKFLLSEYGKAGMDVEAMIGEQIALSNAHDKTLPENKRVNMTREMAIEEIAAEACSRMLIDTDAGKKLAAWGQQSKANADFLQKLKQMLQKLINRLRTALNGADPGSEAAKAFMQLDKKVQQILSDMFVDMSTTAAERISTIKSANMLNEINTTGDGGARYRVAAMTQNKPYRAPAYTEWDVSDALDDALDHADMGYDNLIKVGNMPNFITDLIGIEGDFYIYRNHAYENMVSKKDAEKAKRPTVRGGREIHFHNLGKERMTEAILSLENPIMTIADSQEYGNPQIVMILPVLGNNDSPLYAALSFYSNTHIKGEWTKKPHIVLTISERGMVAEGGFDGHMEVINKAIASGNVLSYDKEKMRDYLSVIANHTRVGNITSKSLTESIARFRRFVNDFREKNNIRYRLAAGPDLSARTLLTDPTVEGKNQAQKLNLERYRDATAKADELDAHLKDMEAQYAELTEEQKKHQQGKELRAEINKTKNRLNMANENVRKLEQSPPLQTILKNKRSEIFQETAKTAENAESMTVSKEGLEIIENEFTRLAREADSIGDLKAKLKAEAKRHRGDNALWEKKFNKLLREYELSQRVNESDRKIIEDEFKRLVEEYEKASAEIDNKDAKIDRLEYVLEKEAKKHHDDNEMWSQEFRRLLRLYERADRKIDSLKESFKEKEKARVEKNSKNAVKKSIQTKIRDLRKLFARGKDDRNVKSGMRDLVSTTLATAEMLFNDSYTEEDMIRNGVSVAISEVDSKLLNRANDILRELESPPATIDAKNLDEFDDADKLSEWYAETEPKLKRELNQIKHKLEHVFKAERNAIDGMIVSTLMDSLRNAYMELKNSGEEYIRAAYNADNLEMFNSIITNFGSSRIVDMSLSELETLNKVYGIVLGSVRQANKYFSKGKKATIAEKAKLILEDFKAHKPTGKDIKIVAKHLSGRMGWNYEKLYYALKRIDSDTFTEMYRDLVRSEDVAQRDMIEAFAIRDSLVTKYGYNSWAVNKKMDQVFLDSSGKKFQLTLGEAMSLYAYGRRKSALNNLKNGGFEFAETMLKDPDPATTYKIDEKQFAAIESVLTEEQKAFARDMQKYLADVMGAKGNEVSQELYGIDLFNDPYYFPVHIAADYRANVRESTAKKEAGFASQKNAGFTYVKNENAVAPIMLESFLDTWAYHVNEMARYHASVLPLENIRKVMNYGATDTDLSITAQMKNSYGDAAFDYFNNLYREANSGSITDKIQEKPKKLLSKFRKGSTMYKLSVWFQQPGSITRAEALVNRRYFRGPLGIGRLPIAFTEGVLNRWLGSHNKTYEKMLKYAPGVTMTKELGGFDTATGTSMLAALKDTKKTLWQNIKSGTGKEIAGAVMNLVDDNFIANIPNKMDKVAWIAIWQACENEQKAKHKGMDYNSDAFLELVGERFTEVIQATQVYDSIFAKSPMLKSKNLAVQYLVSFMNEPNTVANMAEDVVRSVSKGKWKDAYKSASAIIRSTILTNALAAFAYAMGDDDEDEKYWESYARHFVSGVVEDANPISYIPGGKDVYSLMQGYDQERPDMSAWADVVNAIIKERTLSNKDTSEMTDDELEAHEKEQRKASWDLVFTIGNLVGIPVGNIRKEATAIIKQIGSKMDDPVSWGAMKSSIEKELWSTIPKWWRPEDSKTDDLYWAIMEGDTTYVERLKKQYKDDEGNFDPDKYDNALKKALQENDPRIKEAAQARLDHDLVTYGTIYNNMVADGKFTDVVILKAITAEFNKIKPDAEKEKKEDPMLDVYGAEEYYFATLYNAENKDEIYDHLIDNKIADGMTEYEANQSVMTSIANELRDNDVRIEEAATAYLADNYSEYSRIYDEILAEGNFSDEIVSKAVRSKINQLKPDEPTEPKDPDPYKSRFTADDYYKAIMSKSESIDDIYNDLYQNAIADGKSDNEAKKAVTSSIATALRNNDSRVNEAAVAHLDGNVKKRVELINAMVKDGFSQNAVVAAVDGEINKLSPNDSADTAPKQKGLYRAEDVATSVIAGDSTTASKAFNDLVDTNKANGKPPKEAKSAAQNSVKTALRDAYESGTLDKTKAINSMVTYCGMERDDAKADVMEWDYDKKYPDNEAASGWFDTYVDKVASSGIRIETYISYREKRKNLESDKDKNGKAISGSLKKKVLNAINSMPITSKQKDALYLAEGYPESKIHEAPWH